jgi:DNA-binding CsgD family transcriptional regulator
MHRLRKVIPVDAFWVATADPATRLFTSAVKEAIPDTAVPRFVQNEFLEDDFNKFRVLAMSTGAPVSSLYRASENRPETSRRYREILTPLGFGDELRAAFRAGGSVWGFACMHRERGDGGYTSKDASLLAAVAPHLAQGLRTALLFEHSRRREWPDHEEGPGLVMIDDDFSISATTPAAERWIAEFGDGAGRLALPEAVQSVVARLWALERSPKDKLGGCLLPQTRVRTVSGRWLVIHASRLSGPGAAGQTAVMLESARAAEIAPLLLNAYGLTRRETEVTLLTLCGVAIDGIAAALSISPLTVQQHLKTVFDKTGVSSRRELVARIFAEQYRPMGQRRTSERPEAQQISIAWP